MNAIKQTPSESFYLSSVRAETQRKLHLACNRPIRCCYTNYSKQFQIIRMAADGRFLEKAVPPQSRAFFEARPQDRLEIHTGTAIASILTDRIPCEQLACLESLAS